MTDVVETLRKSVSEALGKANMRHKEIKALERGKQSERLPRLKQHIQPSYQDGSSGGSSLNAGLQFLDNAYTSRNATNNTILGDKQMAKNYQSIIETLDRDKRQLDVVLKKKHLINSTINNSRMKPGPVKGSHG